MKALIFGVNGQDGFYLTELLRKNKIETIGISRSKGDLKGSVADQKFVEGVIKNVQPDYVFHFAANSTTRHEAVFDNHEAIATGTINISESVYRHSPKSRVFLSGSAMQFENKGLPIDENTPFAASSPYSASRIYSIYAGRYYREKLGLKIYVGYFFNHDSPLRGESHVNQKIASAAKCIAAGSNEKLQIGDLKVRKEFNFAGDFMNAVWILLNQDKIFEAVIGCGEAHSIEEWVKVCFEYFNLNWRDYVETEKDFKSEYQTLVSNPALIKSLGWQPKYDIGILAKIMLEK